MRKLLSAVALCACAALLFGCAKSAKVTPEAQKPGTEQMEGRSKPADEGGAKTQPGGVQEVTDIGLERIHFDTDKSNIRDDAREILKKNADVLKANPNIKIQIEGHCDERNTVEYNLALGERRAAAAKDYLVKLGVDAGRISTISYGEERPISMGHDETAWWQNRHCEFMATK